MGEWGMGNIGNMAFSVQYLFSVVGQLICIHCCVEICTYIVLDVGLPAPSCSLFVVRLLRRFAFRSRAAAQLWQTVDPAVTDCARSQVDSAG